MLEPPGAVPASKTSLDGTWISIATSPSTSLKSHAYPVELASRIPTAKVPHTAGVSVLRYTPANLRSTNSQMSFFQDSSHLSVIIDFNVEYAMSTLQIFQLDDGFQRKRPRYREWFDLHCGSLALEARRSKVKTRHLIVGPAKDLAESKITVPFTTKFEGNILRLGTRSYQSLPFAPVIRTVYQAPIVGDFVSRRYYRSYQAENK